MVVSFNEFPALFSFFDLIKNSVLAEEALVVDLAVVGRPLCALVVQQDLVLVHDSGEHALTGGHLVPPELEYICNHCLFWDAEAASDFKLN